MTLTNQILELAAQSESLLNLYMEAKRELHLVTGVGPIDVSKFPIVGSVREQIEAVRGSIAELSAKAVREQTEAIRGSIAELSREV